MKGEIVLLAIWSFIFAIIVPDYIRWRKWGWVAVYIVAGVIVLGSILIP